MGVLATFWVDANEPPDTNFATLGTLGGASNAQHLILEFDQSTDEFAEFGGVMPRHYREGSCTITIMWAAAAATGDVVWNVDFKSVSDDADDLDTKAFAGVRAVTATAPSAIGEVGYDTINFSNTAMDSIAAGEYFRMRVSRDANNASDDMTADAHLLCVEIQQD